MLVSLVSNKKKRVCKINYYNWTASVKEPFMNILFQISTWIGLKDDLYVVSMSPAVENIFSRGTEVAGIPKINIDSRKKLVFITISLSPQ